MDHKRLHHLGLQGVRLGDQRGGLAVPLGELVRRHHDELLVRLLHRTLSDRANRAFPRARI